MKTLKKGFTLIELLVVVAIIGILATVVILNVNGARSKAQVSKAKELMATASKIAGACQSFSGSLAAASPVTIVGGTTTICAVPPTGADLTDSAGTTTGIWPDLTSSGYAYGSLTFTATTFNVTATKTGYATVTCSNSGCI